MSIYKQILIEISGRCNAKCKWCVTGIENRKYPDAMPSMKKTMMSFDTFQKVIHHLLRQKLVDDNTVFGFYNWGEPFLHPDLYKFLVFMKENNLKYALSTNSSVILPQIEVENKELFSNLQSITFSYCGFSQKSYNRIHQFDFEKIKSNTEKILSTLHLHGFSGTAFMAYHLYQFNQGIEASEARKFSRNLDMTFLPSYAYINNPNQAKEYLRNNLDYFSLKDMGKDLCFHYVDELLEKRPEKYHCPILDWLIIDEKTQLLACCGSNEILGNILECSSDDVERLKGQIKSCKECRALALDYWATNPVTVEKELIDFMESNKIALFRDKEYILFGAGEAGQEAYKILKQRGVKIRYFIDNDVKKQGTFIDDICIKSIEDFQKDQKKAVVIITSEKYKKEMKEILLDLGKVKEEGFCNFRDMLIDLKIKC